MMVQVPTHGSSYGTSFRFVNSESVRSKVFARRGRPKKTDYKITGLTDEERRMVEQIAGQAKPSKKRGRPRKTEIRTETKKASVDANALLWKVVTILALLVTLAALTK